jgi:hypothetical protein
VNALSPAELREVLEKEDDFGHELRVGRVLRSHSSAAIQHGGTYTDPVTAKPRQFDYRFWFAKKNERLSLAVECKNISAIAPLIISGTTRSHNESFHDLVESRQGTFNEGGFTFSGLSSLTWRVKVANAFYPEGQFVGKSLLRIQADKKTSTRSGESEIYDKWAQALSSAVELASSATALAKHLSAERTLSAVLPVIVVPNEMLWRAVYDSNGAMRSDPERIEDCTFFVGREIEIGGEKGTPFYQKFIFSHVHFFTVQGLQHFLVDISSDANSWGSLFAGTNSTVRVSGAYDSDPADINSV